MPKKLIQVTSNIILSEEEHQGNLDYDEMRDNELQDRLAGQNKLSDNPVY